MHREAIYKILGIGLAHHSMKHLENGAKLLKYSLRITNKNRVKIEERQRREMIAERKRKVREELAEIEAEEERQQEIKRQRREARKAATPPPLARQ